MVLDKYICKEPMQRTQSGEKNMDIYDSDNQKYCNTLRSAQHDMLGYISMIGNFIDVYLKQIQ